MLRICLFTNVFLFSLFLVGCEATSPQKLEEDSSGFEYNPNGREEFVFDEMSSSLQEYGYKDICFKEPKKSTSCFRDNLSYHKYVGKRGYYTKKPKIDYGKWGIAREAILETGEVIYALSSKKYSHVGSERIPLELYTNIVNFKPHPLADGSNVFITGYSTLSRERFNVSSQNKHSYDEESIKAIRKIARANPLYSGKIADLLSMLKVDVDDFNNKITISGMPYLKQNSNVSIELDINENGEVYPFLVVSYTGSDWLFVKSFTTSADGHEWNSGKISIKRDYSSKKVWEWGSEYLTAKHVNELDRLASAKSAKVRFYGSKYYSDYELSSDEKSELSNLIELYRVLVKGLPTESQLNSLSIGQPLQ